MTDGRNDGQRISRRTMLAGTALALGAAVTAAAASEAEAQEKIGQADAQYQASPKDGQHCSGCANFQGPHTCQFVQGNISPNGWCQLFSPKT